MAKEENVRSKMLIVDDEEINRVVLSTIFEDKFDVLQASSGEEAISLIESQEISVVLLDIIMPGLSGYDVLMFLKKKGYLQKFPAIVISGLDDVQSRGRLYDLGASDIITKPFVPEVVLQHVGSVLEYFGKTEKAAEERKTILIADDTIMNRAIIAEIFYKEYEVLEAGDGQEAIELLIDNSDKIAAVILDVIMPRKSGFEVIEYMRDKNYLEDIPVVFITAMEKPENELRIWNLGASDVISKPFLPHIVKKRVENVINLYNNKRRMAQMLEYQERKQDFFNSELVDVLSSLIEYRSLESGKHIMRIRIFSKILLTELVRISPDYFMDKETVLTIADATAMHDIGKIVIPDTVLNKPGRLTKEEFDVIKQHPAVGSQILSRLLGADMNEYMRYAYDICRYHHERWDGKGYPDGLIGNEIPIWAQISGIADVYDALTTDRVYKAAYDHDVAINMILNGECGQFSPLLLTCLKNVEKEFEEAAKKYRDGLSPRAEQFVSAMPHKSLKPAKNRTAQTAIYKYFAMLQLIGDIIYEFNTDTGDYHLVYPIVISGNILRENGKFFEDMSEAVSSYVHHDDREKMTLGLAEWQEHIKSGLTAPEPLECRIYHPKEAEYHWYKISYKSIIGEIDGNNYALVQMHDIGGADTLDKKRTIIDSRISMLLTATERLDRPIGPDRILEYLSYFGDCFTEYDLENGIGTYFYDGHKSVFPLGKGKDYLINFVHEGDVKDYKEHLTRLLRGNEVEDLQFRMSTGKGDFRRKWKRSVLIRDANGNPVRVFSSTIEADRLLCHVDDIKIKSQIDQMTGSLNKTMTENSIAQVLGVSDPDKDKHAMVLIDIDDFKMVNDTFGHLMGDGVIKSVSGRLRTMFRNTDIVGRIGGDEFLVLIKNDNDEESIKKRIQQMFYNLDEIRLKNNMTISISVGVARYPKDGTTYTELFDNADKALYQAKTSGKARFCFAEDSAEDLRPTPKLTRIDSEADADKDFHDILSHMLLEIDNSKQAIESIFDFTARTLTLSSVVAVDRSDNVLFEWQADTSYKPFCRLGMAISKLDYSTGVTEQDGAITCEDVDNLDPLITAYFKEENVGAFIAAETGDRYARQGYIIFTAREKGRKWHDDEIRIARIMAKMFSLLHAKSYAEAQSREAQLLIDTLFESESKLCYVIDESFHIMRTNKKCKNLLKKCEGEYCYNVLASRSSPCENCPALKLTAGDNKSEARIYLRKFDKEIDVCAQSSLTDNEKKLIILSFDADQLKDKESPTKRSKGKSTKE